MCSVYNASNSEAFASMLLVIGKDFFVTLLSDLSTWIESDCYFFMRNSVFRMSLNQHLYRREDGELGLIEAK